MPIECADEATCQDLKTIAIIKTKLCKLGSLGKHFNEVAEAF